MKLLNLLFKPFGVLIFWTFRLTIGAISMVFDSVADFVLGKPVFLYSQAAPAPAAAKLSGDFKPTVQLAARPVPAGQRSAKATAGDGLILEPARISAGASVGEVSDRVRTFEVRGPHNHLFGVMWFYLYPRKGVAKRVFKVIDVELAKALKRERYFMSDAPYDPIRGIEPLRKAMLVEVQALLGKREVKARDTVEAKAPKGPPPPAVKAAEPAVKAPEPAQQAQAPQAFQAATASLPDLDAAARPVKGVPYEGIVTVARMTTRQGRSGPYQSFCLTLNDGAKEIPLYGAELQRAVQDIGLRPGERAKVVFMGKQRIDIPGQTEPGWMNLYQVSRSGAA